MKTNSMLVIIAIMAAMGLVTAIAVDILLTAQEAEARGCRTSVAANASKGRCIQTTPADELTIADENQEGYNEDEGDEEDEDQEEGE